jgi:hypothetical protein
MVTRWGSLKRLVHRKGGGQPATSVPIDVAPPESRLWPGELSEPHPRDAVDEWGYESFPASDPPQH